MTQYIYYTKETDKTKASKMHYSSALMLTLSAIILSAIILSLLSSCNFLNVSEDYFSDEISSDSLFANSRNAEAYMWDISRMFPDEGRLIDTNPATVGYLATDEAFSTAPADVSISFTMGEITPNNLTDFFGRYQNNYRAIRRCNTLMQHMAEIPDLTAEKRATMLGYTHFMRGYAYYRLLVDWGPAILLGDDVLDNNQELSYYDRSRGTYDETVDYVCSEFEEAAKYLPLQQTLMEFGLPTKGAAYGLIARLRIYQASPAFNGGTEAKRCFGSWKRKSDGIFYVNQTYDEKRWAVAAAACKRVMDLKNAGRPMYKLHTVESSTETPALAKGITKDPDYYKSWPEGAADIDPLHSYADMFNGESVIPSNSEWIWARYSNEIAEATRMSFPLHLSGWNHNCPTQKVVDAFRMFDGRNIDDSSNDYPYSEEGFTTKQKTFSGYRLNSGVFNMYNNREMRFYASIGFSECFWPMTSSTTAGDYNQTITYYYDSPDGKQNSDHDYPATGYVIKKFIHPSDAWAGTNAHRMKKAYPMIRYADVLLMYAEALNNLTQHYSIELGGTTYNVDRNTEEIRLAFNQVRHRAGLPGLSEQELANPDQIQKLIEQERMVELLFENARYYDVRRWGIYEQMESEPIMGMNMDGNKDSFYRRVVPSTPRIGKRIVNRKLMFLPLPDSEVRKMPLLDQNPGW